MLEQGIQSVESASRGLDLFGSLSALTVEGLERDETHYLLVPRAESAEGYSLFSKRVIPVGFGSENSLPKVRVFHLPDEAAEARIRDQFYQVTVQEELAKEGAGSSGVADRLEQFAREVDRETEKMSGGLLLIGGALTFLNPLVGVGLLAGGVLPALGGKVAKAGVGFAGDRLRSLAEERARKKSAKSAAKEVRRLKPEVFVNPILRKLEVLVTNATDQEDPLLEFTDPLAGFPSHRYFAVTLEAVTEVYAGELDGRKKRKTTPLLGWLRHLKDLREETSRV